MSGWLYIVKCSDGSYYAGTTRTSLELRIAEHNAASFGGWIEDAIAAERQVKGWSRAKKEASMRSDFDELRLLARRKVK
jgi:putative endonuclease